MADWTDGSKTCFARVAKPPIKIKLFFKKKKKLYTLCCILNDILKLPGPGLGEGYALAGGGIGVWVIFDIEVGAIGGTGTKGVPEKLLGIEDGFDCKGFKLKLCWEIGAAVIASSWTPGGG